MARSRCVEAPRTSPTDSQLARGVPAAEPPVPTAFWRGSGRHTTSSCRKLHRRARKTAGQEPLAYRARCSVNRAHARGARSRRGESGLGHAPLPKMAGRRVARACRASSLSESWRRLPKCRLADGDVRVQRVVCAVDCGQVVNPTTSSRRSKAGSSSASPPRWNEITIDKGRVQQTNFGDYRMMRSTKRPARSAHRAEQRAAGRHRRAGLRRSQPAVTNAISRRRASASEAADRNQLKKAERSSFPSPDPLPARGARENVLRKLSAVFPSPRHGEGRGEGKKRPYHKS